MPTRRRARPSSGRPGNRCPRPALATRQRRLHSHPGPRDEPCLEATVISTHPLHRRMTDRGRSESGEMHHHTEAQVALEEMRESGRGVFHLLSPPLGRTYLERVLIFHCPFFLLFLIERLP
jgi:hypothetical protein